MGRELERQLTAMVIAGSFSGLLTEAGDSRRKRRSGSRNRRKGSEELMSISILI
jgi:hypothetical protein